MSVPTYSSVVAQNDKPLVWLHGEIKTPPFSSEARIEAGYLLRRVQGGESLGLPHSRPMPVIGANCHELRVKDATKAWRIFYHVNKEAIVILEVFNKTTKKTPDRVLNTCQTRLGKYIEAMKSAQKEKKS
jgi:phage-related protein